MGRMKVCVFFCVFFWGGDGNVCFPRFLEGIIVGGSTPRKPTLRGNVCTRKETLRIKMMRFPQNHKETGCL